MKKHGHPEVNIASGRAPIRTGKPHRQEMRGNINKCLWKRSWLALAGMDKMLLKSLCETVNLSSRLAGQFSSNTRHRGEDYYRRQGVTIEQGSPFQMLAHVKGSGFGDYEIELFWKDGTLSVWCDCSNFVDHATPCKHLWAGILAADDHKHLSAAAAAGHLAFDCDGLHLEADDTSTVNTIESMETRTPPPTGPSWQKQLSDILTVSAPSSMTLPVTSHVLYIIDVPSTLRGNDLVLLLQKSERKSDGGWKTPKALGIRPSEIAELPRAEDRHALWALTGNRQHEYGWAYGYINPYGQLPESCLLSPALAAAIMPLLTRTERCYLKAADWPLAPVPLTWDAAPWIFRIEIVRGSSQQWVINGFFLRGKERMDLAAPVLVTPTLVFANERVAPLANDTGFEWISALRTDGPIRVPENERDRLLARLLLSSNLPPMDVPDELHYEERVVEPCPCLKISKVHVYAGERLRAELSFAYEGKSLLATDPARGFFEPSGRRFIPRQVAKERAAYEVLREVGVKFCPPRYGERHSVLEVAPSKLPRIVRSLLDKGWHVEAEGKVFRRPGKFHFEVSSGIDWFELQGQLEYEDVAAELPQLLAALRRGDNLVQLGDGTYGMLPEEWLRRVAPLVGIGTPENGHIRFRTNQAGLLDALLSTQPQADCDETFTRIREELRSFSGIKPAEQPGGFVGQLRTYQCEGLSWMHFLGRFRFGGCLADDMGVGKTAQVLALLETRRELRAQGESVASSLVVAPRSLIFNWKQEAARFTPQLRVLDHSGFARNGNDFSSYDLVLITYGTLRRDIVRLRDFEFDYVVLDEAQAVKNADSETSKAVRLLQGRQRLALSGTPVENHLGELWTLFEFLNPGMLGASSAFKLSGGALRNPDEKTRGLLAHALRPFILRRTKEQVAPELPPKTQQTVYCEMDSMQRKLYEELRQHYRASLLKRIESDGMAKSKIQVLEALLRLRQAACHPGLLDPNRSDETSAKLESLLAHLSEVLDEGHKALVFSQFTSLLTIVRERLDRQGVSYEYLDGATRDRQARVERFQTQKDCPLFLISLKAGGLGLNLTAAEYVFILDPWWNPAVEAQAIDRAHRIGQERHIFAYRLITRDTVEEKVLELQKTKCDLATAIIGVNNSMIRDLGAEDLAVLLS
jgi:superfamily II DNA or RNA helicase